MRRRRRRGPRPLWFPPLGTNFTIGDDTTRFGGSTFFLEVPNNGAIGFIEFPLTFDFGQERVLSFANNTTPTETLSSLMASTWRLRRIVGDVFATYAPGGADAHDPSGVTPPGCIFTAGFMVRNIDETGLPPSGNVDALNGDDYDDPWIWRRSWLLGQAVDATRYVTLTSADNPFTAQRIKPFSGNVYAAETQYPFLQFPTTNVAYGYKDGGSRVDQRTNRLIGPEQRLMIHFAAKALPVQSVPYNGNPRSGVTGVYDLRLLGHLSRATNRRNAAR